MKRRDLLKAGVLAGTGAMAGCLPASRANGLLDERPSTNGEHPWAGRVRNIIFLIYDGTGFEDAAAAGHFARRILNRPLLFERFMSEGRSGVVQTHSLTSVVTDSAAASSAYATGRKVVNSALSMFPDDTQLTTILELAKDRGLATGLVTTTRITHATPAGWAAKVPHRNMEDDIALQYLDLGPDVLLGGGQGPFEAAEREDGRDLYADFERRGYEILKTSQGLARSNGSRLLGTFTPGMEHLPYEVDRRFQGHPAPSLSEITRRGLDVLSGSERGFVLQVEAGRIDLANHANDPGGMIWDWMAADEALEVLMDFVDRDGETLLIMAPDHDTGGSAVYGFGPWYLRSTEAFETLSRRRASHEWLLAHGLSDEPGAGEVRDAVDRLLGVPLSPEIAQTVARVVGTSGRLPEALRRGHPNAHATQPANTLGQLLSTSPDWTPDRPNIAYATGQHTAGLVPAVLYGAMVPPGNLGVVDNTEFFRMMVDVLRIDFENPMMTEEEALQLASGPMPAMMGSHG